jgi:hypothetical protein
MAEIQRITIGVEGAQALEVRVTDAAYKELRKALEGDRSESIWHVLPTQDAEVVLDLKKVVYVSLASQEHRVGF